MQNIITTNLKALNEVIENHGLKKTWLAAQLGISETTMMVRLAGKVDFRHNEIVRLAQVMHMTEEEKRAVGWVI